MGASVQEQKTHYPVMTEKHVADRWQVSLKTLRRWRLAGEGPVWHKLFRQVRYHDAAAAAVEPVDYLRPDAGGAPTGPGNSR